jgi:hypothetical protein
MFNFVDAVRSAGARAPSARQIRTVAILASVAGLLVTAACAGGTSSPTGPTGASISVPDPTNATSLTYTANVAPILQSDCTVCHNSSTRSGGYDLTSYSAVMRAVTPGSAQSPLVRVTQPGGLMYSMLRTTAAEKSATIKRWVVDFNAVQ